MIAIFAKSLPENFIEKLKEILFRLIDAKIPFALYTTVHEILAKNGFHHCYASFKDDTDLPKETELFLSIGGDGTILEAVTIVKDSRIPLLGINTGRLGFLADISFEEIQHTLDSLIYKKYDLQSRSLLEITSNDIIIPTYNFAFNDFTLQKNSKATLVRIKVLVNNRYLNTYWADGIIISTATGSTAYSLSVGGPILLPESKNLILSPIASHNLSVRPLVIENNSVVELSIEGRFESCIASFDGRIIEVPSQTTFIVNQAKFPVIMAQLPDNDFFTTLRNKLMWGVDKRNNDL